MAIGKSLQIKGSVDLTNPMWFGIVCTLIGDHMRQHSGQNVVHDSGLFILTTANKAIRLQD